MSRTDFQEEKNKKELLLLLRNVEGLLITAANEVFQLLGYADNQAAKDIDSAIDLVHSAYHGIS